MRRGLGEQMDPAPPSRQRAASMVVIHNGDDVLETVQPRITARMAKLDWIRATPGMRDSASLWMRS